MADLSERVSKLETRLDDHGSIHEFDHEDRTQILEGIKSLTETVLKIVPTIEALDSKTDGINARLDKLNGSVQAIKLTKADKSDLDNACKDQIENGKAITELQSNYKWIYVIGGFIALLLLAHLGLSVYSIGPAKASTPPVEITVNRGLSGPK